MPAACGCRDHLWFQLGDRLTIRGHGRAVSHALLADCGDQRGLPGDRGGSDPDDQGLQRDLERQGDLAETSGRDLEPADRLGPAGRGGLGGRALTLLVVVVTANHFWLDGIVAALLVLLILAAQRLVRGPRSGKSGERPQVGPVREEVSMRS